MLASGVHHLSFTVTDLERSKNFYQDVLGLETIPRPDMGIGGIWYSAGNAEVHLIELPASEPKTVEGKISPLANHNAFAIDDYAQVLALLKSKDVEVLETSAERGQMWIRDPDGNVLELIAPPA